MSKKNFFNCLNGKLELGNVVLVDCNFSTVVAVRINIFELRIKNFRCNGINLIVALLFIGANFFILAEILL